jgi:hypothetical protein
VSEPLVYLFPCAIYIQVNFWLKYYYIC